MRYWREMVWSGRETSFMLCICFTLVLCTATSALAQSSTSAHQFGGHAYLVVNETVDWVTANAAANDTLGYLAIIDSEAENEFIYSNLLARGVSATATDGGNARYAWLGGSDAASEGDWVWVNSNSFEGGYTNWGIGFGSTEPDNYNGTQHFLAMGLDLWPVWSPGQNGFPSQWNDLDGANLLPYVIEFDSTTHDTDFDGMPDWHEFIAGTDPDNPGSTLGLALEPSPPGTAVLAWNGSGKCWYAVEATTNLVQNNWSVVGTGSGPAGPLSWSNTVTDPCIAYRVRAVR